MIIIPYIICYCIKVIRQFGCFTENFLTRETTQWITQTYNIKGDNMFFNLHWSPHEKNQEHDQPWVTSTYNAIQHAYDNVQLLPSYEVNIKLLTLERLFSWVPQVGNFQCSPHVKAIIVYHNMFVSHISKFSVKHPNCLITFI
jgi:hypothetical protein